MRLRIMTYILLCSSICIHIHAQDENISPSRGQAIADLTRNTAFYIATGISCKAMSYGCTYMSYQNGITSDMPSIFGGALHAYLANAYGGEFLTNTEI